MKLTYQLDDDEQFTALRLAEALEQDLHLDKLKELDEFLQLIIKQREREKDNVDKLIDSCIFDVHKIKVDELPKEGIRNIVYEMDGYEFVYIDDRWVCLGKAEK